VRRGWVWVEGWWWLEGGVGPAMPVGLMGRTEDLDGSIAAPGLRLGSFRRLCLLVLLELPLLRRLCLVLLLHLCLVLLLCLLLLTFLRLSSLLPLRLLFLLYLLFLLQLCLLLLLRPRLVFPLRLPASCRGPLCILPTPSYAEPFSASEARPRAVSPKDTPGQPSPVAEGLTQGEQAFASGDHCSMQCSRCALPVLCKKR